MTLLESKIDSKDLIIAVKQLLPVDQFLKVDLKVTTMAYSRLRLQRRPNQKIILASAYVFDFEERENFLALKAERV